MKTIREQFEEIWPVPEGICWNDGIGEYVQCGTELSSDAIIEECVELDIRLETFTRCQESQAIVTSLNDELVGALECCADWLDWLDDPRSGLGDDHKKVIKQARSAIAKARGEK